MSMAVEPPTATSGPVAVDTPPDGRAARGRAARAEVPRASHATLEGVTDRDPVELLDADTATRAPELVPIRYGRMLASPFAFYRGSAAVMAHDLAAAPSS